MGLLHIFNNDILKSDKQTVLENLKKIQNEFEILKDYRVRAAATDLQFVFETEPRKLFYFVRHSSHYELYFSPTLQLYKNIAILCNYESDAKFACSLEQQLQVVKSKPGDFDLNRTRTSKILITSEEKLKLFSITLIKNLNLLENENMVKSSCSVNNAPSHFNGIYHNIKEFTDAL